MHHAYFDVRFRIEASPDVWPARFVIISAWATTGQTWTAAQNHAADQRLGEWLAARNLWHLRVTGYSPTTGHAEPSWAVSMALEEGRDVGRDFEQDAIYFVDADQLSVTHCRPDSDLWLVGGFRERLDRPDRIIAARIGRDD
ncbi:MAG: DUF3293 domain-containing protein [Planctomycetaceae bacterium]